MNMLVNIKREVQASELDFIEVEKLILQCEKAKSSIKVIYESIKDIELDAYQIVSAITRKSYSSSFNTEESALKQISSCFWRKLTEIINLRNFISEKEYDALSDKIARHEIEDFTMDNVNVFLESIWSTRHMAYARKVDSLDFLHKSFFNQFNCLSFTQSKLYMPASKLNRRFNLLRRFLYTQDKILKHFILPNTCST